MEKARAVSNNLMISSKQDLYLSKQTQILKSKRHTSLQKLKKLRFFIQLLNAWLNVAITNFLRQADIEESFEQHINPHIRLNVRSIPPKNITDKFAMFKDLCHTHFNPERMHNVMNLILNAQKQKRNFSKIPLQDFF